MRAWQAVNTCILARLLVELHISRFACRICCGRPFQAACAIEVCIDEQLQRVTHEVRQRRALQKAAAQVRGSVLFH